MGSVVAVSGTTSIVDGQIAFAGDPYRQTQRCLEIIEEALAQFGLDRTHVLRTRLFVTDISQWESYGKAHGEFFAKGPPATSMIEVKGLIDPQLLVEIEADAVVPSDLETAR